MEEMRLERRDEKIFTHFHPDEAIPGRWARLLCVQMVWRAPNITINTLYLTPHNTVNTLYLTPDNIINTFYLTLNNTTDTLYLTLNITTDIFHLKLHTVNTLYLTLHNTTNSLYLTPHNTIILYISHQIMSYVPIIYYSKTLYNCTLHQIIQGVSSCPGTTLKYILCFWRVLSHI